jgi:hypothetical protein
VLVLVASADATLAFAENGGVQTESKTGEIFWSFLACDGKPENFRSVLLVVRRGEVTPKQGPRLRPALMMREGALPDGRRRFRLRALLRVAPGPQGHARSDLAARLLHQIFASKKRNRINGRRALHMS